MEYRTHCIECEFEWDQSHLMKEPHSPCPECKSRQVESVIRIVAVRQSLDAGWDGLNNGLGQYFPQLEDSIDCKPSAHNHFRSRNEGIEACKRRGFQIIDK